MLSLRAIVRLALALSCFAFATAGEPYRPAIHPSNFTHMITNPWFPLTPGTVSTFIEQDGREKRENKITVTHDTKTIMGVKCVVVHDAVTLDGVLLEDTYDCYAQDKLGTVWYFGEATKEFKSGGRVSTDGSWEAGVGGAQPGVAMLAHPRIGERYRQEYLLDVAEDIAQIAALDEAVTVPLGTYKDCVLTREWSMLESGTSKKWYAKGVGLVRAECTSGETSLLISHTRK